MNEELKTRIERFQEGLKKLSEETQVTFKPQISPDGPVNVFVDLKKDEDKNKTTE